MLHRLIYGPSAELRNYETMVLDSALAQLPVQQAAKMKEQLEYLPYRQRHSDDRVLAFFSDQPGALPPVLFMNRSDDLVLAEMDLVGPAGKSLRATLFVANGSFFSIEFAESPAAIGLADGVPITVRNVSVNALLDSPR